MTRRRTSAALVATGLLLGVAGCAGVSGGAGEAPAPAPIGSRTGDEYLRAGDFDGAVRAYEREGDTSPVGREKLRNAKTRSASAHANAALRAAEAGDADRAAGELAAAEALAPELPIVRTARETVAARTAAATRAAELRGRAASLVASDPDEAQRLLAEAQAIAPETGDAAFDGAKLRREATLRAEADRAAERAAAAWAKGDREAVVKALDDAEFGGAPVAQATALRRRIETELVRGLGGAREAELRDALEFAVDARLASSVEELVRDRLVDRLVASASDLAATNRPAVAALLEVEAKRLRSSVKTPALDGIREKATQVLVVKPFDDATGGRVDGLRLARAVRERIALDAAGGGQSLRAIDEGEGGAPPEGAIVLTGRVLTARESDGRVGRENRTLRYKSGSRMRPNPEYDAVLKEIAEAAAEVRRADDEKKNALTWLNSVRALAFQRGDGTPRPGDVEYQTRLAAAQARVDRADLALTRARDAEFALRQTSSAIPPEIEEPVYAEHVYAVTNATRTSQITARLDLTDAAGASLFGGDVSAAAVHKETYADGFAAGGLAPDPDETPDDATMAALAIDRFAAAAAGTIRTAAGTAALRHLARARDHERTGRREAAAEGYALYLLATAEVASRERADAARALAEIAGVHVAVRTAARRPSR